MGTIFYLNLSRHEKHDAEEFGVQVSKTFNISPHRSFIENAKGKRKNVRFVDLSKEESLT